MVLDDIISLADAAEELGLGASTLRHQAQAGRLQARVVGKTWITTRQEVERYRRESLGRPGRPASSPNLLRPTKAPFEDVLGKPGEPNIFDDR
jgi:hypothetical protein